MSFRIGEDGTQSLQQAHPTVCGRAASQGQDEAPRTPLEGCGYCSSEPEAARPHGIESGEPGNADGVGDLDDHGVACLVDSHCSTVFWPTASVTGWETAE